MNDKEEIDELKCGNCKLTYCPKCRQYPHKGMTCFEKK